MKLMIYFRKPLCATKILGKVFANAQTTGGSRNIKKKYLKGEMTFKKKIKSNEDFDVRRRKRRRINDYLETEPEYEEKIVEEEDRYEPSPQHQIEKSSRKRRKKDYSTTKLLKQQKIFVFITKPIVRKSQL